MKGQALLLVFLLLLIVGIMIGALASMWQAEIKIRSSEREGLIAFYLAQAGVERAKIELVSANGMSLTGAGRCPDVGSAPPCPASTDPQGYPDLDIAGDNYTSYYYFQVEPYPVPGYPNRRVITGTGRVLDGIGDVVGYREVEVVVDNIEDTVPPIGTDDDNSGISVAWSWREK